MVNFNPVDEGYDCQVKIWPSKYEQNHTSCLWQTLSHKQTKYRKGRRFKFCRTVHCPSLPCLQHFFSEHLFNFLLSCRQCVQHPYLYLVDGLASLQPAHGVRETHGNHADQGRPQCGHERQDWPPLPPRVEICEFPFR